MRDDFGIHQVEAIKVALNPDQVASRDLPPSMDAKTTSSQCDKFVAKHGMKAYELEALMPADLQSLLRDAINAVIDREAYDYEVEQEKEDARFLDATRLAIVANLKEANVFIDEEGQQ
jgi:hypothetical protein